MSLSLPFRPAMSVIAFSSLALTAPVGCLGGGSGAVGVDGGAGGSGGAPGGGDGGGGSGGEGGAGPPVGPGGDPAFDSTLPDSTPFSALGDDGVAQLCREAGAWQARYASDLQPRRCLEVGVSTAVVGARDPATCERLRDVCNMIPMDAAREAQDCVDGFDQRDLRSYCQPGTVGQFEACLTRNIAAEVASPLLECRSGIDAGTSRPQGLWDCACNVPQHNGPPPADDLDWDGVPDDEDLCPESAEFQPVSEIGCTRDQDQDGDGVPTAVDACPDGSDGPVSVHGCTTTQDPDQDGVVGNRDLCHDTPEGEPVDDQGCGASQDTDGDRQPDHRDACPGTPAGEPVVRNGCAVSQDEDIDGVSNEADRCPQTGNPEGANPAGCDRAQDEDSDGVPNAEDRCPFTGIDGDTVASAHGCSVSQDRDQDGVENFPDVCEDTPPGHPVNGAGCSRGQDEDWDGVVNADDACPFTPPGEALERHGCTFDELGQLGAPLDGPPEGSIALRIAPEGADPIDFRVMPEVVEEQPDGARHVRGNLMLPMPNGQVLNLPRADVRFSEGLPGPGETPGFRRLEGEVDVPLPAVELLDGLRIHAPVRARLTYDLGAAPDLQALGAPLQPDRAYLVLFLESSLEADLGPLHVTAGVEQQMQLILDPLDPAFYVRVHLEGAPFLERLDNVGVGFSMQGRFRYEPADVWGVEPQATPFDGHLAVGLDAGLLSGLPAALAQLVVSGQVVVDLDPDENGRSFFQGARLDEPARMGVNGEVVMELAFPPAGGMSLPLAQASVGLELGGGRRTGWATGHIGPDELRLPLSIPMSPVGIVRAAVLLAQEIGDSYARLQAELVLEASRIRILNLSFNDVLVQGEVVLNAQGIRLTGHTHRSIHDSISLGPGGVMLDAQIGWDGSGASISLEGEMTRDGRTVRYIHIGTDGFDVER